MIIESLFIGIAGAGTLLLLCHQSPKGATTARPRQVMRHINARRVRLGQPPLYLGDPTLPASWTCNDVRRQQWRNKR